ncbi:MAG: hypothetical protein AAGI37_02750 [Planctomycetota bacterium]
MDNNQVVKQWRANVYQWAWLRMGVLLSMFYCLAWGVVSLVVRVLVQGDVSWLWWGGLSLLAVWAGAGVLARRQVPSDRTTIAMLDRDNELGGLLMAESAPGREPWEQQLGEVRLPRVRWRGLPSTGALALSLLFVFAALLVPMPEALQASSDLDVSRSIERMQEQVEVLEEEQILDTPEAEEIREAMERIKQEASGDDPSKTWEALDHLAQQIEEATDEATNLAQQRQEEAAAAEALSQALQEGSESLDTERLAEAMATLAELSEAAAGEPTLDGFELPTELAEALAQDGKNAKPLTPEMLEQLAEAMAERKDQLREMLEALEAAGFCETPGQGGENAAEIDPTELLDWLAGEGECDSQKLLSVCRSMVAGRGGIDDGPGHVEMIWKDPSSEEGVAFDPEVLPPVRLQDLLDARMLGTSKGNPDEIDGAAGSAGGALTGTKAEGGSAVQKEVLPRHRGAVQRYFDRDTGADDPAE